MHMIIIQINLIWHLKYFLSLLYFQLKRKGENIRLVSDFSQPHSKPEDSKMSTNVYSCMQAQSCPTLWTAQTVANQTPLSMEFSRQEYQSGLPFPPPGYFPNPGIKPASPAPPALVGRFLTAGPWKAHRILKESKLDITTNHTDYCANIRL